MIKVIIFFMVFTLSVFAQDNYMKEDGTFDWENYLESDENYVKQRAYNDTNTLIQLFNHYDKVKDDPFSLSTLSNDIVNYIYNDSVYFFDGYGDVYYNYDHDSDSEQFYNMYKILYDNMHKFDVEDKKEIRQSLEWFLNNQIHEVKLFGQILGAFGGIKNELIKIELRNSYDEVNGLTIKYNGRVVPGILGKKTGYEYTIDYNGKKDIKVRYVELKIISGNSYNSYSAILIGENYYYIGGYSDYAGKIRDLNKHEDGITSVEIVK